MRRPCNSYSAETVSSLLECILNQVPEVQVSEQLQAERYERTDERQGYRNGYSHAISQRGLAP